MRCSYVDRSAIEEFLTRLHAAFPQPGRVYLVGQTTQVFEGWREQAERLEFSAEVASDDRAAFNAAIRTLQAHMEIKVLE